MQPVQALTLPEVYDHRGAQYSPPGARPDAVILDDVAEHTEEDVRNAHTLALPFTAPLEPPTGTVTGRVSSVELEPEVGTLQTGPTAICTDLSTVRRDSEGRYCLNDLHKAAGGEKRHQPSDFFLRHDIKDLCDELRRDAGLIPGNPGVKTEPVRVEAGRYGGTYVVKELVYAYAMWVSPAFHLKVIRFFDRGVKDGVAVADNAAADLLANPLPSPSKAFGGFAGVKHHL